MMNVSLPWCKGNTFFGHEFRCAKIFWLGGMGAYPRTFPPAPKFPVGKIFFPSWKPEIRVSNMPFCLFLRKNTKKYIFFRRFLQKKDVICKIIAYICTRILKREDKKTYWLLHQRTCTSETYEPNKIEHWASRHSAQTFLWFDWAVQGLADA